MDRLGGMEKSSEMKDQRSDDSTSLADSDISLPVMERSGSIRRSKRRSTIITVQMISKRGQLGGQKVNTVQVAAESKFNELELDMATEGTGTGASGRRSCSIGVGTDMNGGRSSSASTTSETAVPLKMQKISTSDSMLQGFEERPRSTMSYDDPQLLSCRELASTPSDIHLDTLQTDSCDFEKLRATRPRQTSTPDSGFKTLPQSMSIMTSSDNSFSSGTSSTHGLVASASDTNISNKYQHKVPSYEAAMIRKSYDAIMAQRHGCDAVVTTCASEENLHVRSTGIPTSASDSNINVTYHRRHRPHTFHQESHRVIEETENISASDYLWRTLHGKRTVSESEFDVVDGRSPLHEHLEMDPNLQRETWTSYPLLQDKVKYLYRIEYK